MQKSKIKNQKCIVKFKIFTFWIVILHFTFYILHLAPPALSQSPSPEPSPTVEEEAEKDVDEKIKDLRNAVEEKVREKLETVKRGQKRAFVGEISEIANSTLILTTRQGQKQTKVSEDTTILNQNRKEITLEDLESGSFIIAMGYLEEADVLAAVRIVMADELKPLNREVVFGKVTDVSEEEMLTVKNEKKDITYTVETTTKTTITKKAEGEAEKVNFSEIESGDYLVAVGTPTENEEKIISAKIIHVIPASPGEAGGPDQKPEAEEAESETTPEPTPSPSPTEETE